jgi:amino acid permease
MPIDWADLPLQAIALLAGLAFVSSLIGHSLTRNAFVGAILTVIIFTAIYIAWDFYPHGYLPDLRFPTRYAPPGP